MSEKLFRVSARTLVSYTAVVKAVSEEEARIKAQTLPWKEWEEDYNDSDWDIGSAREIVMEGEGK
jgi:hypothetical protein